MAQLNWVPPSASGLRAFEAAARTLNFTRAAAELNQTQGAISHQIRELEGRLGVSLFERRARGLVLTEPGRRYLPFVQEALERLRAGEELLRGPLRSAALTVSVSPNFAAKWLVPRLGRLALAHPDLDLRISASVQHVEFARENIDVAVRHGDGNWPHLQVARLCAEWLVPVCSPALYDAGSAGRRGFDLRRHVLIHDADRGGWRHWLASVGIEGVDIERGPVLNQTSLAIDAAVAGQGVALARSALAALDLRTGRLVRPLKQALPAPFAYWVVAPRTTAELPKVRRFRAWLLAEAAEDQRALPIVASP